MEKEKIPKNIENFQASYKLERMAANNRSYKKFIYSQHIPS
jgi:hypothetical protein